MMKYNPDIHKRKSIRLKHFNYSSNGAYFITLCTKNRECILGNIVNGKMVLSDLGEIVKNEWNKTPMIRHEIKLDIFIIMPNHFHGIIFITNNNVMAIEYINVGATGRSPLRKQNGPLQYSLGSFIGGLKSITTKRANVLRNTPHQSLWQRNYYEHVIRNDVDLNRIREYIINNPIQWQFDLNHL